MTTNYSSPRNMEKRMLSRKEAAAYMGISVSTVSKLFLTVPDFPAFKAGNGSRGRILIDRQMLDAWIDKNLEKAI